MNIVSSSLIAIMAAIFFIWLFRRLAIRLELVDRPGGRKQHEQEVPLIGGIAIFFGFCFALLSLQLSLQHYRGLIAGSSLLVTMGIVDDFRELDSKLRLIGQVAATLLMIGWGHLQVSFIGNLLFLGNISLGFWAAPFTILLVVGYLNAMNMMDGQDGLAGGVALVQTILLGYLCWHTQRQMDFYILIILGLLLMVFLAYNMRLPWRRYAGIFLGDAGSTFIAFVIAWVAISVGQHEETVRPVVILWILALPVFDLFQVCIIRFIRKKPLFSPSRDHFHHLLNTLGISADISTWILMMLTLVTGLTGILLNYFQIAEGCQFIAWIGALLIYLVIIQRVRNTAEQGYVTSGKSELST